MKVRESKMLMKSSNELGQEEVESLGMVVLEGSWPTFLLLFFILLKKIDIYKWIQCILIITYNILPPIRESINTYLIEPLFND